MRRSSGLTLIELTVSLAIVGMLMAAVMTVMVNVSAASESRDRRHDELVLREELRQIFGLDLAYSQKVRFTEGHYMFLTSACLDAQTLSLRFLPVTVEYRVVTVAGRGCLLRTQRSLTAEGVEDTQLICSGVRAFRVDSAVPMGGEKYVAAPLVMMIVLEMEDPACGAMVFPVVVQSRV